MGNFVFGADGGGTKTLGVLATQDGNILSRRTVGASNPNVVGFEVAAGNLYELIQGCCAEAKCSPGELQSLVLGLAGAGHKENRARLRDQIIALAGHELPITIETDARIGLEGTFEGNPGILIIAGTGSIVIAKSGSGEIVSIGGWGRAFGDEGSGFYFGLEALKSLRLYYDGRGGSKLLAEMIGKEFGLNSRERIIAAVYQEKFEFSKIAPLVLTAADLDDGVALQILSAGATELSEQALALAGRLKYSGTTGVAFTGGLIERENVYTKILKQKISERIPSAEFRQPSRPPAEGALLMAIAKLGKP